MFFNDHPPSNAHVRYGELKPMIEIATLTDAGTGGTECAVPARPKGCSRQSEILVEVLCDLIGPEVNELVIRPRL
jgi:hypothetical protein